MKTIKIIFFGILAYTLAAAVVLSSLHIRDIAANHNGATIKLAHRSVKARMDDVSAKAVSELHNHVEKTSVKAFMKSVVDHLQISRSRQTQSLLSEIERPFSVVLMEMLFMFRLAFAFAVAR